MSNINDFIVEDGILKSYIGIGGNVVIPEGVTEIGRGCGFYKLKEIESITIPTSMRILNPMDFGNLTNLKWIECKGELEIKFDYAFPGCKNMVYLICNPCKPLSQLPSKWKRMLAIGVVKYIEDGNTVSEDVQKEVKRYISSQNKKLKLYQLGYEYPFVVAYMIREKMLSEELYDEMIVHAQENQLTQVLTLLLEGRSNQYPAENFFERAEKRIDKDIAYAKKMEDHTSTAYLKTQWSWEKREDGTLILCTYKGMDSEVFVPAVVGKKKVTAVRGHIFMSPNFERNNWMRNNIKKIHFAEGIQEIGDFGNALAHFSIPTKIYLPQSVCKIGSYAFYSPYYDKKSYTWKSRIHNVKVYAPSGSYAETYAKEHNIPFVENDK